MQHIRSLVFGEFDIDKGSVIRSTIGDALVDEEESYIAEQLLPDGCEKFSCSRSFFFVRRPQQDSKVDLSTDLSLRVNGQWELISKAGDTVRIEKGGVLSLISSTGTQQWKSGADRHLVRSESQLDGVEVICLQVQQAGELAHLQMEVRSEDIDAIGALWQSSCRPPSESRLLNGITCTLTKKDIEGKRGGINKGVALLGQDASLLLSLWPLLYLICDQYCDMRDPTPEALKGLFGWLLSSVDGLDLDDPSPSSDTRSYISTLKCVSLSPSTSFELTKQIPHIGAIRLSKVGLPWEYQPLPNIGVADLCLVFREKIASILTGILCGRRIIVKSHKLSATEVSEAALSIGIIGSLINPSFIPDQVFPYTSLSFQGAFLDSGKAFVAGTMNPMYDAQPQWWDLLCDLDTGDIRVGVSTAALVDETTAYYEDDKRMMNDIVQLIRQRSVFMGSQRLDVEMTVRDMLKEYMSTILCSAISAGETNKGIIGEIQTKNTGRLLLSQFCSVSERFEGAKFSQQIDKEAAVSVHTAVATLRRLGCSSSSFEVLQSLQTLLRRVDDEAFRIVFLDSVPHSLGGLAPIAVHIMCPDPAVRVVAVAVLRKVEGFPAGQQMLRALSSYLLLSYEQAKNDLWDTCC